MIAELKRYDSRTIPIVKTFHSESVLIPIPQPMLTLDQRSVGKDVEIRRLNTELATLRTANQNIYEASIRLASKMFTQEAIEASGLNSLIADVKAQQALDGIEKE